jgi:hypothetical protein
VFVAEGPGSIDPDRLKERNPMLFEYPSMRAIAVQDDQDLINKHNFVARIDFHCLKITEFRD